MGEVVAFRPRAVQAEPARPRRRGRLKQILGVAITRETPAVVVGISISKGAPCPFQVSRKGTPA